MLSDHAVQVSRQVNHGCAAALRWDVASSQAEENASNWLLAVAPAVNRNQPLR